MPSFNKYSKFLGTTGHTIGEVRQEEANRLMEWTWDGDIASQIAYQFDMYHDPDPYALNNVKPTRDMVPLDVKFIKHTSQTYSKDLVTFHMQMKPHQKCNVSYYKQYEDVYGSTWPLGEYVLLKDSEGVYNRWLVVAEADNNVLQFPTWEVLRCDLTFQYVMDGKKMSVAGVQRSQNSYNSGIWTDYLVTTTQDQGKFIIPLNRETEKIFYNMRMIIDAAVLTEPRTFQVSKVNRISPDGLVRVTLAETEFNSETDYIEKDEDGNVIGMWADYFKKGVEPTEPENPTTNTHSEITYSGKDPVLKIGGNYKKFTVKYYDEIGEVPLRHGAWEYKIDGEDVKKYLDIVTDNLPANQIKIKFIGSDEYIGKNIHISYVSVDGIKSTVIMNIQGL